MSETNLKNVLVTGAARRIGAAIAHDLAANGWAVAVHYQDSADDAAWADLITFSTVTGVTQERATVAGTVDRYVRAQISAATALTSVTFAVAFARNYV